MTAVPKKDTSTTQAQLLVHYVAIQCPFSAHMAGQSPPAAPRIAALWPVRLRVRSVWPMCCIMMYVFYIRCTASLASEAGRD